MCFSSPDIPPPPPPPQEEKAADPVKRRRPPGQGGSGTVLTGPVGAAPSTLNTGGTTLLGG